MSRKIAFLFSGQGAQYVGMGIELFERYSESEQIFDYATQVLGRDIKKLCFASDEEVLKETQNTQPALFTVEIAILSVLKKYGINPDIVAGFSIGEYSALYASGALDFMTGLYLVNQRAVAMDKVSKNGVYGMGAITGENIGKIEKLCRNHQDVWVSNFNSHEQVSITGKKNSVQEVIRKAQELNYRTVELQVSGAFHSPIMKQAAEEFEQSIKLIKMKETKIPIILNVSGDYYKQEDKLEEIMVRQIFSPVQWSKTIERMLEDEVTDFIEIGPGKVLSKFVMNIKENRPVNVMHVEDMLTLSDTIDCIYN